MIIKIAFIAGFFRVPIIEECVFRGCTVKFELCIFDFDGTIVDTRRDLATAVNAVRAHYGLPEKGVEEITGYVGDGIVKLVERSLPDSSIDIDKAVFLFNEAYKAHLLDTTAPYPGIREVLSRLNGFYCALLTNKSYQFTKAITDSLDFTEFFSLIIGGDTLERKKPHPDGVEYILQKSGVNRKKAVMIGDGKNDILAAHISGISSIYVRYGYTDIHDFNGHKPDFSVDSALELLAILKQH